MITIHAESALTSILLIAAIVAVILLIVILFRVIKMMDKAESMLDEGMYTVHDVTKVVGDKLVTIQTRTHKISDVVRKGADDVRMIISKIPFIH